MSYEVLTRPEPSEELKPVSLDDDPEHLAYIGSKLAEDLKSLLTQFLRQNRDVFAWKQADMGGIDPTVITHRLNTNPSFKPIKQKPRSYMPGDLVLKKLLPARKNPTHGKLGPNWEGPYIISRVVRPGNYELQTKEGKILQHTWNAEHLKRFYQ